MKTTSIKRNFVYKILYEILLIITPLITAPYTARVLGPDGIGIYSYTFSVVSWFALFAALGTANYGTREIAQNRDDREKTSRSFWGIEITTVITSSLCLLCWVILIGFSTDYKYYFIALIPHILAVMADISWFYTGLEKVHYTVLWNAVFKILGIFLLFRFVRDRDDLVLYLLINSATLFLGNLSMWIYLPKFLCRTKIDFSDITLHFRRTVIYFIPSIAVSIYTILDKTLIGLITKDEFENGYYEQGNKIITLIKTFVYGALNSVMGARMSYWFAKENHAEIQQRLGQSLDIILLLGWGSLFGLVGIADNFVPLFFGQGYTPVIHVLRLMAPLIVIVGISNCLGNQYLLPAGQIKRAGHIVEIGAVINLAANILLIPGLGATGAIIGSLIAETAITYMFVYSSRDFLKPSFLIVKSRKKVLAGSIMYLFLAFTTRRFPGTDLRNIVVLQMGGGTMVYLLILVLLRDSAIPTCISVLKSTARRKQT